MPLIKGDTMQGFSEKVFLKIEPPTEDFAAGDQQRIKAALAEQGYAPVDMPLGVLRKLYPLCRDCGYEITVSLVSRETGWTMVDVEAGDRSGSHYGLAVDYGSTKVVMQLVDMTSGEVIAEDRETNGQVIYGTDILTRITYTMEAPEHFADIQRATAETFNRLLARLSEKTGVDVSACPAMIISGNTTMIHFLLKLDAWTVFASPYAPVTSAPGWFFGSELGMDFHGMVYIIPAASNYVGGDIVSGLLKLDIHKNEEPSMFFDIGTNGELVVGCKHWMMAGAGAAGPALEGYISKYGMRADDGAIEHVKIRGGELEYSTIGGKAPVGICGSGIIDLIAQMRLNGWINIAGALEEGASDRVRFIEEAVEIAAVYAEADESAIGKPLYFSQTDIHQYIDTKAAAYIMVECLLETAGCSEKDLAHCYLSGAFAAHSDLESAITIGIFPDLPREKFSLINNTSLEGARILLLDRSRRSELEQLAESIYCVQFASIPDFIVRMQAAKFIPHTDMDRYPSIKEKLEKGEMKP
ncbi:MAG: DUF4445 domain-containing protein [Oscillospiraceae bacterium]|nr:DUF4445 domain-containing protein [Oscillospiraceae bacterium]